MTTLVLNAWKLSGNVMAAGELVSPGPSPHQRQLPGPEGTATGPGACARLIIRGTP